MEPLFLKKIQEATEDSILFASSLTVPCVITSWIWPPSHDIYIEWGKGLIRTIWPQLAVRVHYCSTKQLSNAKLSYPLSVPLMA